ncbi:MAG: ABC transporter substrate-binding protein [Alphaproteobacteria bacterium]|nr:ABC transporter substrate-binding protein [Alphaproteobacteria bacterium]
MGSIGRRLAAGRLAAGRLAAGRLATGPGARGLRIGSAIAAILLAATSASDPARASACPSVADPKGLKTEAPQQGDLAEIERLLGKKLAFQDNPLFAERVKAGQLPPVAQRLPAEPLVVVPYEECGRYGGTLRGLSRALESGSSEVLSWRQVNLVRLGDDLSTIVPNVARAWRWSDDRRQITFTLRKGHRWSDGSPFTVDDVVFFIDDIIKNKDLHPSVPSAWMSGGRPVEIEKLDDTSFRLSFAAPYPGLLHFLATGGSFFAPYAPKHHYARYHLKYNAKADEEAKAGGQENWVKNFHRIWSKWKDAETIPAHALTRPTLESHIIEVETNTQRRIFVANPYYFKVDTAGNQLPYIDRHHERFLNKELSTLAILNGEVDQKAQGVDLEAYPVLKENEAKGGYRLSLPPGQTGFPIAFNLTHRDPALRAVFSDVRFRRAMSLAINREEMNETLWFGLGKPAAALPLNVPFVTDADRAHLIKHDPAAANRLLDDMGLKRGANGIRLRADGRPLTLLWEYSTQFASGGGVQLVQGYWRAVGVDVNIKEITTQLTRQKAKEGGADILMEWDVPYEPNLVSDVQLYMPPYRDESPLFGASWREWNDSKGGRGEEPPAWAKRLYAIEAEWRTVVPGSARYLELGRELVRINLENMTVIGTVSDLPGPTVVSRRLANVRDWTVQHYNYARTYPFRPDQWYFAR